MTEKEAKKIGSKQGIISGALGILIAQLIMACLIYSDEDIVKSFFWFLTVNFKLNLLTGVIILFFCGHLYGQIAGIQIIIRKRNFLLVGMIGGMAVLLTTAFLSGWIGLFQEGLDSIGINNDLFKDYIFKPFFWITSFGLIPALLVGIGFGAQIRRKAQLH